MRKLATATLAALTATAAATVGMASAQAYVVNTDGTYSVTADEIRAAFGAGVDLSAVTFSAKGGNTVYLVPCAKTVGKKGKVVAHTFKRQAKTTWTVDDSDVLVEGAITGFTVTTTAASVNMSKVVCPKGGFSLQGSVTPYRVTDVDLIATYNGVSVELENDAS